MIKRLFSVVISLSLVVSSLGAMERKPRVPKAQQQAREYSRQRRQGQPSSAPRRPGQAPRGPVKEARRPVKKAPKRPVKQGGQRRPLNQRNNPRPQNVSNSEDDSSSCDCLSYDSSDEYLLDNQRPHEIFNNQHLHDIPDYNDYYYLDVIDDMGQNWVDDFDRFDADRFHNNNDVQDFQAAHEQRTPKVHVQQLVAQQPAIPRNPVNTQVGNPQNTNQQVDGDCSICTEQLQGSNDLVSIVPCGHPFHRHCIERWRGQADTCPMCRAQIERLQ